MKNTIFDIVGMLLEVMMTIVVICAMIAIVAVCLAFAAFVVYLFILVFEWIQIVLPLSAI